MIFTLTNHSMPEASFAILRATLTRRLGERLCSLGEGGYTLTLVLDETYTDDRYTVVPGENSVALTAGNAAALHAAVGRFLFASRFDGHGGFTPLTEAVDFTPARPLRGMYFATHFYNFYHNAPIEEVYTVIEDLALRGCNALLVWYDMHHFTGVDQPESLELITRLKAFMHYAKQIGMLASILMLANEGFASSPEQLRATNEAQNGYHTKLNGYYFRELCPSTPGGLAEILAERSTVLEAFADVQPDYVCFWPYDQGGCTCADCAPWGANGLLKIFPHFVKLVREVWPGTRFIFSTWYFDKFYKGEWEAFYPRLQDGTLADADYIMSFFHLGQLPEAIDRDGIPEGVRFIDFPEISMHSSWPWGGFGANPLARFLDETNEKSGHLYAGGYPYSEGIFEDINKHIILGWYSGQHKRAADAVREYARFEFCCDDDALVDAILRTETALARARGSTKPPFSFQIKNTADVDAVWATISAYDARLPESVRALPRWRMIYLRAMLDVEIARDSCTGNSKPAQDAFRELFAMYYACDKTYVSVCPPLEDDAILNEKRRDHDNHPH